MITYQQEFLATAKDDAKELLKAHWDEIAVNKDKIFLNPDWDIYEEFEHQNKLVIFTARDEGKLVGYCAVLVGKNLHYKDHVFAVNDVLYMDKSYRRGFTGINLMKFAEKCLKQDGVSVMQINTKVHRPFDILMQRLGFNLVERVYSKYIGD